MTIDEKLLMRYAKTMKCARKECREKFELTHPKKKFCSERCRKLVEKRRWQHSANGKASNARYKASILGKAAVKRANQRAKQRRRQAAKTQHP